LSSDQQNCWLRSAARMYDVRKENLKYTVWPTKSVKSLFLMRQAVTGVSYENHNPRSIA
jgi:hypothetical protein